MEEVHRRNVIRLKEIIAESGWPGRSLVGEDGAIAAWFIAQHAIDDPPFQRKALGLQREALARGDIFPIGPAFLEDRICYFEGRPQIYGRQFEVDENGNLAPYEIANAEHLNERRRALGLNSIEERTKEIRTGQEPKHPDPQTRAESQQKYKNWLSEVGWRK